MKKLIYYSLYSNKEQDSLIAMAYSKEQLKEVSLEYSSGVWFEYDVIKKEGHLDTLINERLYKGRPKFAKNLIEKIEKEMETEEKLLHSGIGDLR